MEKLKILESPLKKSNLEICVYCGEQTDVKIETPADKREYYVEGCGQLHKKCYEIVYTSNTNRD